MTSHWIEGLRCDPHKGENQITRCIIIQLAKHRSSEHDATTAEDATAVIAAAAAITAG